MSNRETFEKYFLPYIEGHEPIEFIVYELDYSVKNFLSHNDGMDVKRFFQLADEAYHKGFTIMNISICQKFQYSDREDKAFYVKFNLLN